MSERWIWTQKEDIGPSPRYGLAMAYEAARQRVVLFGGEVDPNTWEWDGVAWTQVADMGPPGRWYCGMVYDDSRQRLVLFGGVLHPDNPSRALGDTWEWDGTDWTQVADMGPSPRYGCAMTYDTVHKRVVLFGGNDPSHGELLLFNDTWEWEGTEWNQIADSGPSKRQFPAMAFDSSRKCPVLFGGHEGGARTWLGDTWEFKRGADPGSDRGWVKRQNMGPREIISPTMTYTAEHTVLFGGPPVASGTAGQSWKWDGRLWTQRQNMGPPARGWHNFAYDSQRDRVVLFGGQPFPSLDTSLGDTWELAIIEQQV